jgi:methionine synthase II (cobalamin-independent)
LAPEVKQPWAATRRLQRAMDRSRRATNPHCYHANGTFSQEVESPELVASRIRRALPYVYPANLLIAPDCGMKYLPRALAFGKLQAMVAGARMVRAQL